MFNEEMFQRMFDDVENKVAPKADKSYVDDNKRDKMVSIGLNDVTPELITAIQGGEGAEFNLLSIPR